MLTDAQEVLDKFEQLPVSEKKKVVTVILRESFDVDAPEISDFELHSQWRVDGSRVSKYSLINAFKEGASAEEIALRFPTLNLKQIYSVINDYLQHPVEFEQYFNEELEQQEQKKQQIEKRFSSEGIRQKLLERSQNLK